MLILGIETSCDETSVALVEDGQRIVSNSIASQVRLHAEFGGVVPELASRAHIQRLIPMIDETMRDNHAAWTDIDALAVTLGPGLVGALLIGVETAKALAFAKHKPLIPVHHIAGHLYSPFLSGDGAIHKHVIMESSASESVSPLDAANSHPAAALHFPYVGLVVSGGHTSLILVHSPKHFEQLGETMDDAAGEAFDKVAKLLDLGYPGGPLVEKQARTGNRQRFPLPRPMLNQPNCDFSFSGLKTAALKIVRDHGLDKIKQDPQLLSDICASFQEAVVEVLLKKAATALDKSGVDQLAIVGGVACNGRLREAVAQYIPGARVVFPPPILCTDNAAMIAGLAWHHRDQFPKCDLTLNAQANLRLDFQNQNGE